LFAAPGHGDPGFRAIDKKTGAVIFDMKLPGSASSVPMTYSMNGWQFIVVAVAAQGAAPELVAFTLPTGAKEPTTRDEN
jgi:quinoprotein glucose dehydrogenase